MYGVVAGITAFGGVSALAATAAHADSTFTFTRIGGADRYATAGLFTAGAFPGGATTIYLADGLPGHQSDALAASGWGGVNNYGALLTDNTSTVPANTTSALSNNKVKNVVILGGTNAVSQAQQTALTSAGYTVTRIAGASRLDTMQALDDAIPPGSVGKDSAANPTAILASGDDAHLVDALSAGGTAYGMKFPVILTSSSSSTLPAQSQQVITALGIKHLVVVGGTAAVPASQYQPAPAGVAKVDVEAGADRSATSMVFSDFAISQTPPWDKNSKMELARGDDGADALASAPYSGITDALSTCVTLSPSDPGSCPAFASEHKATLAGPSIIAGLQGAVTDAAAQTVAQAGGGSVSAGQVALVQSSAAPGGTVNGTVSTPGSVQSLTVSGCGFSSQAVTFDSGTGNFTITIPSGATSGNCTMTFTATKTAAAGGGTQTTTVPFTVGSGSTAGCAQTTLPQLCSASIVSTTTSAQASASNPAGTVIAYTFNQSVSSATIKAAGFHAETFDGTTRYNGATVCGVTGSCALPTSANTVNILFTDVALQNTSGAEGAQTLTLATVDRNTPAVTVAAGGNTAGSAPIGSASTSTLTAGTTNAPDLESIGTPRAATTANFSAIDLTFDQAAFGVPAGANTGLYDIVYAAGSGSNANGISPNTGGAAGVGSQEATCTGPGAGNTVQGSNLTTPGGNGTTTLTIVCPNTNGAPGTTLTSAQIARIVVQPNQVTSAAIGGVQNGAVEASDAPHGSAVPTPSLTSVSLQPGSGTALDVVVWNFDQAINPATVAPGLLGYYNSNDATAHSAAGAGACAPGNNPQAAPLTCQTNGVSPTAVAISFAHGALAQAVGGYAQQGAVANGSSGVQNADDELGSSNPNSTTITPGTINAPQLTSVKVAAVNGVFGSSTTGTYTFTQAVTNLGAATNFLLYDQDGTKLVANSCAVGTGAAINTVTCSGYTQGIGGTAATASQLSGATLGTVDNAVVTGSLAGGAPDANPNPEGGVSASH